MSVVVLEGPDGGGKTTLATSLMNKGFDYVHCGPPEAGTDLLAHYLQILDSALNSQKDVVIDRLWLGERIYGPICRNNDRVGVLGQTLFQRIHNSKPILHYLCLPPIGVAKVNYIDKMKDKDDYVKSMDRWSDIYRAYYEWFCVFGAVANLFDYKRHTVETVMADLEILNDFTDLLPKGTVGSPQAKYLFVGDQPNHDSIDVPFFATNGSSGYFNRALKLANFKESEIAIGNAYSPTGERHDGDEMIRSLPKLQKIILMGGKAHDWYHRNITKNGHQVHGTPHPSYLKRFKGHDPAVMAEMFKEIK
jgi:predicted ATPase